jgi:hypothetical protein
MLQTGRRVEELNTKMAHVMVITHDTSWLAHVMASIALLALVHGAGVPARANAKSMLIGVCL